MAPHDSQDVSHPGTGAPLSTDEVFARVYDELKRLARGYLRSERPDHTLQPTALVHEAYLKLARVEPGRWPDRGTFVALAARAMRRILVDHARAKRSAKRSGQTVTLDSVVLAQAVSPTVDLLALDSALDTLSRTNADHGRVIELHLFGGLSVQETAAVLKVTERTIYRQLRSARAWLESELDLGTGTANDARHALDHTLESIEHGPRSGCPGDRGLRRAARAAEAGAAGSPRTAGDHGAGTRPGACGRC